MTESSEASPPGLIPGGISTRNEKPLHAALKHWLAAPEGCVESVVDGYVVDVVRGDLLIEVQTSNFAAIRGKLADLCARHPVRLVHPIAAEKWVVTRTDESERRRKSPKRGRVEDVFREMVHLPSLMKDENFSLEVLLIQEEEVRRPAPPRGRWRKGWVREERRLLQVIERHVFRTPSDLAMLLPPDLPDPFTARELAERTKRPLGLAQKLVYSLCRMDALRVEGKRGRASLYTQAAPEVPARDQGSLSCVRARNSTSRGCGPSHSTSPFSTL